MALLLAPAAAADEIERGKTLFERCRACHALEPGQPGMAGPDLAGLDGRRVGGAPGFDYSPALRQAFKDGVRWDAARLMAFLADPDAMFRGTWMSQTGLRSEADRRAVAGFVLRNGS